MICYATDKMGFDLRLQIFYFCAASTETSKINRQSQIKKLTCSLSHKSSNSETGSSIKFFTFTKKVTDVLPSMMRWS